jgi:ketosteroid isomerase-like protein
MMETLLELEKAGWAALSSSMDDARAFYADTLHNDAVMLFPGGLRLEGKDEILDSFDAQAWSRFEITSARVIELAPGAGALIYRVAAERGGSQAYEALVCSTYARVNGQWKLVVHQHTSRASSPSV